ncbi:MAG: ferritin-like domain-containing protein [Ilumatobacteraceae bacterium]
MDIKEAARASGGGTPDSGSTVDDVSGNPFDPSTSNPSDVTTGGTGSDADPTDPSANTNDTQPPTGATTGGSTTAETSPATTTTAPPRKPTAADIELLGFAQSVELTIRDLYDVALSTNAFDGRSASDVSAIREAHEGYGTAIGGLIGRGASDRSISTLFARFQSGFVGSAQSVATAAAAMENVAAATHLDLLGELEATDGAALIASIAIVEARNATVLNVLAGATSLEDQLAGDGEALSPSEK